MPTLVSVCGYCDTKIREVEVDRPIEGVSTGICKQCFPFVAMEFDACADGDKVKQARARRILNWIRFTAEIRRRGQQIKFV